MNGSYKDFVTDRYKLGYYLVGKARSNYGDQIWEKALTNVARKPLGIVSFSNGLQKSIETKREKVYSELQKKFDQTNQEGFEVKDIDWDNIKKANEYADAKLMLYYDIMHELELDWNLQDVTTQKSNFQVLSGREKYYTNKQSPKYTGKGELIYLKQGLSDAMFFEKLGSDGKYEKVFVPGFLSNTSFDSKNDHLIWAEFKQHIRWEHADRSILCTYNLTTKKKQSIQTKYSLFAPSFNSDASKIVAVSTDHKGDNSLLIIDHASGLIQQRLAAGEKEYYQTPKFLDDENIVLILLDKNGKHIVKQNLISKEREVLFSSGFADMSNPIPVGEYIYFNASFTGINNIFAFHIETKNVYQVTSSRFGARDAFIDHNQNLIYSDYTSDGYVIAKAKIDKNEWKKWSGDYYKYPLAEKLSDQLGEKLKPDTTKLDRFEVKRYSKLANLFNFHSWAPVFIDGIDAEADVGVSIASQNKLNTLMTTIGYKKEEGFDNGQFYANLSYQGWWPVIESKLTVGDIKRQFYTRADRIEPEQKDTILLNQNYRLWEWENSISLPFNLSSGRYSRMLTPKLTYNKVSFADVKNTPIATTSSLGLGEYDLLQGTFTRDVMEYQLFGYNIAKSAPGDVQYQWAQILELNYRNTPWGDSDLGNTWSAEAHLYFPGLANHHGLKLYGGYQNRSLNNSLFSNSIKSPRGVSDLYGKHIATLGADYALPLFYPDWNLGPLTYFKRIKMNAFVDYGYEDRRIENAEGVFQFKNDYFSGGIELRTDMHVLRFSAPVDLGVRIGYENQTSSVFADFLIAFNLTAY